MKTKSSKELKAEFAKADFIVLPELVDGTNCGNCVHFHGPSKVYPYEHCGFRGDFRLGSLSVPIDLRGVAVSDRTCCSVWTAPGTKHLGA